MMGLHRTWRQAPRWLAGGAAARIVSIVALVTLLALPPVVGAQGQDPTFSPPLGFRDGHNYAAHVQWAADGSLVEDTRYGALNPDLWGRTCFGVRWDRIYHSGVDLYREDGESTAGAEVTAVADGIVVFADPTVNYPGRVVMIEHTLGSGKKLYSVYMHLDYGSVAVKLGQQVARGQRLGKVMYQAYTGRYPELHPSDDDSHLHFEMRYFLDARRIYPAHPVCNGVVPGRGYTYPERPDDFPATGAGYVDPAVYIH